MRFTWSRSWGKLDPQATPLRFIRWSRLRQVGSTSRTLEIHRMIKVEASWIHKPHPWDSYDDQGWGKLDPQAAPMKFAWSKLRQIGFTSHTHEIHTIKVEANWIHKPHPQDKIMNLVPTIKIRHLMIDKVDFIKANVIAKSCMSFCCQGGFAIGRLY